MEINEYIERLEASFRDRPEEISKLQYLGDEVFNFTTYDDEITQAFSGLMLEVIAAILGRTTFEYQERSENHYVNYLIMVNMPFLKDKLEWGGSIRGAWFDTYKKEDYDVYSDVKIPASDLPKFMQALLTWSQT